MNRLKTDYLAILGASTVAILGVIGLILLLAAVVGTAFEYLIENVLLQRGVPLLTWATFWKGLAVEILAMAFGFPYSRGSE